MNVSPLLNTNGTVQSVSIPTTADVSGGGELTNPPSPVRPEETPSANLPSFLLG